MGKNQDPGSGINIPDPQHCLKLIYKMNLTWNGLVQDPEQNMNPNMNIIQSLYFKTIWWKIPPRYRYLPDRPFAQLVSKEALDYMEVAYTVF